MSKKAWWWIGGGIVALAVVGCGLCFAFGLIGVLLGGQEGGSGPNISRLETRPAGEAESGVVTGKINQDIQVGEVRWKVLEAQDLGNTLKSDNQFIEPLTIAGRFIKVRFEIENQSADTLSFTDVNLLDSQDRKFQNSANAIGFIVQPDKPCLLEQLNPNVPKQCVEIYEVAADSKGLRVQVGDLDFLGSAEGLIELGF